MLDNVAAVCRTDAVTTTSIKFYDKNLLLKMILLLIFGSDVSIGHEHAVCIDYCALSFGCAAEPAV